MSKSAAIIGKGTTISYTDVGGSGAGTPLAEVVESNQPELTVGNVDATHYLSQNDTVEKKSVVWRDTSDLPLTLNYTKAQTATLYSFVGVEKTWTITKPDASTYVFDGFISKLGGNPIPNKDVIKQSVMFTVTGPVTFTAGA